MATITDTASVGKDWLDLGDELSFSGTNSYNIQNRGPTPVEFFEKAGNAAPDVSNKGIVLKPLEAYEYTNATGVKLWARVADVPETRRADTLHAEGDTVADIAPSHTGLVVTLPPHAGRIDGVPVHRSLPVEITVSADGYLYLDPGADTLHKLGDPDVDIPATFNARELTLGAFVLNDSSGRQEWHTPVVLNVENRNNLRVYFDPSPETYLHAEGDRYSPVELSYDGLEITLGPHRGQLGGTPVNREEGEKFAVTASGFIYYNPGANNIIGDRLRPQKWIEPEVAADGKTVIIPPFRALVNGTEAVSDTPQEVWTGSVTAARAATAIIQAGASGSLANSITVTMDTEAPTSNGVMVIVRDAAAGETEDTARYNSLSRTLTVLINSDNSSTAEDIRDAINGVADFPGSAAYHSSGSATDTIQVAQDLTTAGGRARSQGNARAGYVYLHATNGLRFYTGANSNRGLAVCRTRLASGKLEIFAVRRPHGIGYYTSRQSSAGTLIATVTVAAGAITALARNIEAHGVTVHRADQTTAGTLLGLIKIASSAITSFARSILSHGITFAASAATDKGVEIATVSVDSGAVDGVTVTLPAVGFERAEPALGKHLIVAADA